MKRLIISSTIAGLIAGGAGLAFAGGQPGPNGHNTFGLCTAYFAGSQTGMDHKHSAPPFAGLEAAATAANQSVADYCAANGAHPGH